MYLDLSFLLYLSCGNKALEKCPFGNISSLPRYLFIVLLFFIFSVCTIFFVCFSFFSFFYRCFRFFWCVCLQILFFRCFSIFLFSQCLNNLFLVSSCVIFFCFYLSVNFFLNKIVSSAEISSSFPHFSLFSVCVPSICFLLVSDISHCFLTFGVDMSCLFVFICVLYAHGLLILNL